MTAPSDDLNDLQSDIGNLAHLLAVLYTQSTEQEFVVNGIRNPVADQICAVAMIGRDLAERLNQAANACHIKVMADARSSRANGQINALFKDWQALCSEPEPENDESGDERFAHYQALQAKIIGLKAVTARELAIQFFVDTDNGGSGMSDEFEGKIKALIGGAA